MTEQAEAPENPRLYATLGDFYERGRRWSDSATAYGMAVQRPVSTQIDDPFRYLYLSVGALGQYRADRDSRAPVVMEVVGQP